MTYTLFDISLKVARELQIVLDGKATGGTTGTVLDALDRTEADNYWQKGSVWLWYDAGGLAAAPEGEFSILTSSASSTGTLTLRNAFSVAPASGDRYAVARKIGNTTWLDVILQKVNQALQELGPIPQVDVTTVTMATAQTEYTLPIRANQDLRQVLIQRQTIDANDNRWQELFNYQITPATPGNAATLRLPWQYTSAHDLMLVYLDYHAEMQVATDVLSDHIPIERVIFPTALECLKWRKELNTGDNRWDDRIGRLEVKVAEMAAQYPISKPQRAGKVTLIDWAKKFPERHEYEENKVWL